MKEEGRDPIPGAECKGTRNGLRFTLGKFTASYKWGDWAGKSWEKGCESRRQRKGRLDLGGNGEKGAWGASQGAGTT